MVSSGVGEELERVRVKRSSTCRLPDEQGDKRSSARSLPDEQYVHVIYGGMSHD